MGVLIYERTSLQFANLSAQKLMVGNTCEEQPPLKLSETIEHSDELKSAFQLSDTSHPVVANLSSSTEMLATAPEPVNSETHLCVHHEKPLCISTVTIGLGQTNVRDKVCIVQDQSLYNELQKEKLAKQYMKNFFAMVTHELRNPLQGVLGLFEEMLEDLKEDEPKQQCRMGVSTVKLMMGLINDILDLSQLESNSFRLVEDDADVHELVQECVELMNFKYKMKGVQLLHTESAGLPARFRCDKNRYMQILLNLLGNALKFTERGEVWVSVRYESNSGRLLTSVKDSGIGIREADKGKLFALFGKLGDPTHMNPQGCGLGLHICKKLAETMGGEVRLDSEYMKGTTFTYSIMNKATVTDGSPLEKIEVSIPNEGVDINSSYFGCRPNTEMMLHVDTRPLPEESQVLVVDDEVICANVIKSHLRRCGLAVDTVKIAISHP